MDQKVFDAKLQAAGVSDDAIRAIIVKNFDLSQSDETIDRLLATEVGVAELVSLAKCFAVPGFKKTVDDINVIGKALAAMR